jgi:hypothetical protein
MTLALGGRLDQVTTVASYLPSFCDSMTMSSYKTRRKHH